MKYIESETSGHFRRILLAMLQCQRHNMNYPINRAEFKAKLKDYRMQERENGEPMKKYLHKFLQQEHHMKLRTYHNYINNMLELIYIHHLRKNFREILKFY